MESKIKGHDLVPSDEPIKQLNEPTITDSSSTPQDDDYAQKGRKKKDKRIFKKSFWVCCSNIEIGHEKKKEDKIKKLADEFKVKDGFLFSNVEIDLDEDKEKALKVMEKMRNKSCFLVCCSNIEVGK